MSRYGKAAPGGRYIVLEDGYQLCARCGAVHCTEETVVVVYRSPWWGIHTHVPGPDCRAKAVSGWRAVEFALDMRKSNVPTPREAHPTSINGFTLPCVSLLDDQHCSAEMAAVTVSRKEFLPSESSLYAGDKDGDDFLTDVVEKRYAEDFESAGRVRHLATKRIALRRRLGIVTSRRQASAGSKPSIGQI